MGEVVILGGETTLDIPPDRVLESAVGKMEFAILIGRHIDGSFYYASSIADQSEILWQLEKAKKFLLDSET